MAAGGRLAMEPLEGFAIIVTFVLVASVVVALAQTRKWQMAADKACLTCRRRYATFRWPRRMNHALGPFFMASARWISALPFSQRELFSVGAAWRDFDISAAVATNLVSQPAGPQTPNECRIWVTMRPTAMVYLPCAKCWSAR